MFSFKLQLICQFYFFVNTITNMKVSHLTTQQVLYVVLKCVYYMQIFFFETNLMIYIFENCLHHDKLKVK